MLGALRDACRRFSIDTDRVFLTGHGIGGDAAWDIAHRSPGYLGRRDPDRGGRRSVLSAATPKNADVRCRGTSSPASSTATRWPQRPRARSLLRRRTRIVTVVEYLGRGYEPFGDEIQRLFDWMGRRQRNDAEGDRLRDDAAVGQFLLVARGRRPAGEVDGRAGQLAAAAHGSSGADRRQAAGNEQGRRGLSRPSKTTVWLSPELVDFNEQLVVEVNNRAISPRDRIVQPDLNVLLEDARTRADRQHPFWAKLRTP